MRLLLHLAKGEILLLAVVLEKGQNPQKVEPDWTKVKLVGLVVEGEKKLLQKVLNKELVIQLDRT